MIDIDWKPSVKKLREFGWIAVGGFGLIGLVVAWKTGAFEGEAGFLAPQILWGVGVLCGVLALVFPAGLRPIYLILTAVALPIGLVVSNVLLALLFYGLFTPIALVFKLKGRDELHRKWDKSAASYWVKTPGRRPAEDYYRQF